MRIINYSEKYISTHRIQKYVKLLPVSYWNLDVAIKFYSNPNQLRYDLKEWRDISTHKEFRSAYKSEMFGFYLTEVKTVGVLVYKVVQLDYLDIDINICSTLYHELKHVMQSIKTPNKLKMKIGKYEDLWSEKDAESFSFEQLVKSCNKIY